MAYTLLSKGYLAQQTEVLQIYAHMLPICVGGIYQTGLFCRTDTHGRQDTSMQPPIQGWLRSRAGKRTQKPQTAHQ